jgi:hypothetical protein
MMPASVHTDHRGAPITARCYASFSGVWLALAFCRSRKASIASCIAWLGMSASPSTSLKLRNLAGAVQSA